MKKLASIILFLLLFCSFKVNATHVSGGEITYQEISPKKYEVSYIFYRNCSGIPLDTSVSSFNPINTRVRCTTGTGYNLSGLALQSIEKIPFRCDTGSVACSTPNASMSGDGIEKFILTMTLDFNSTPLSNIASCSGDIVLEMSHTVRSANYTTSSGGTFYCRAIIKDISNTRNSSPKFLYPPNSKLCCNQPTKLDFEAFDIDGDSLSYHFGYAQRSYNQQIAYSGIFSFNNPLSVYYPSGSSFPTSDPTNNPPIGINLNSTTGQLIFTPTNCTEKTLAVIEVKEWRKNNSGIYIHIGSIFRDTEYVLYNCQSNQSPILLQDTTHYIVCENEEVCFNIASNDSTINSSGVTVLSSDTLKMDWSNTISGATFSLLDSTAVRKTGRFCWTPPARSGRDLPYVFTVNLRDKNCPIVGQDNKAFYITVDEGPTSTVTYNSLNCGNYAINASFDSADIGTNPEYSWELLDTNFNIISSDYSFSSTNDSFSISLLDTLTLLKEGSFLLRFTINGDSSRCRSVDTIRITYDNKLSISLSDKDSAICTYKPFTINAVIDNASGTPSYQWYRNDSIAANDTLNSYSSEFITQNIDSVFTLVVTDSLGCNDSDNVTIASLGNLLNGFDSLYTACDGDTVSLELDPKYINMRWNTGALVPKINVISSGNIVVFYMDTLGCIMKENMGVMFTQLPTTTLQNDSSCGDSLNLFAGSHSSYLWNTGDTDNIITALNSGQFWVEVTDSLGCVKRDSAQVTIFNNTNVYIGEDTVLCGGALNLTINISGTSLWNTGSINSQITVDSTGEYSVVATDTNGCSSKDTIIIIIHSVPQQTWDDTLSFCSNNIVVLNSDSFVSYLWNTGETTPNIFADTSQQYSIFFVDTNGCSNTDSTFVNINKFPIINLGNDTAFCQDSLMLNAGIFSSVSWNTGSASQNITVTSSGLYTVLVTDSNFCSSIDSIDIEIFNKPNFNLGNDTTFCGDSLLLALATGNSYSWSTGDTLHFTTINASGDYWLEISDSNGCVETDTVNITLLTNTSIPIISRNGNDINSNLGGTHRWFNNSNLIVNQTDSLLTNIGAGNYTAVTIDSNGCFSDTSNTISFTAHIKSIPKRALRIYPNPTIGKVTIDTRTIGSVQSVTLYDSNGKFIETNLINYGSKIGLEWTPISGMLWIEVVTDKGVYRNAVMSVR